MNPFTKDELFPEGGRTGAWTFTCTECGAAVTRRDIHTEWHNKVADL